MQRTNTILINKFIDLVDDAIVEELMNKELLNKKPIVLNPHYPVVDKSVIPSIRSQGKTKITNKKKVPTSIQRSSDYGEEI